MTGAILGIDPGLTGAIAAVSPDGARVLDVADIPTDAVKVGTKIRRRVAVPELIRVISGFVSLYQTYAVWIEDVHTTPRDGPVGAFSFGRTVGCIETACHGAGLQVNRVSPQRWKRALRLPADKDASIGMATRLWGAEHWPFKKHDGRAEAALIGYWATLASAGKF